VGVDHHRPDIGVAGQFLDGADIIVRRQEMDKGTSRPPYYLLGKDDFHPRAKTLGILSRSSYILKGE